MQELIGWGSALVLLPTFGVQTYRQWESRHEPVGPTSLWFFGLALIGTLGQFVYSWMVANWVYLALNGCLVVNNSIGLGIALYRLKAARPGEGTPASHSPGPSPSTGSSGGSPARDRASWH